MIGKNIQELRKKKGLSLSELAERANMSKSYLSNIERNVNQNPSIQILEKIARVLEVDFRTLINSDSLEILDDEWLAFIAELKQSGIEASQLEEYKILIEFINWRERYRKNECKNDVPS
jgi:XRE family transcriptional regulator, master regulator for biofilm formation